MPETLLAVGTFNDWDETAMEAEYDLIALADTTEIPELDEATRDRVRAVAFKGHAPFSAAVMDALPNLGIVANYGVGYDAIDVAAARERGVRVSNTPNVLNDEVADLAVAMTIALSRDMVAGDAWVRSGKWASEGAMPLKRKVSGSRVGICGLGRIGREIADRLAAFKCEIHYSSRSEKDTPGWTYHADPVSLAGAVDILVVALVGGPETEGHVSSEVIAALGEDGILVNISRGTTIDEGALLDALEAGRIRGAALDVFLNEPDPDPRFAALQNVHLQPHQASATIETRKAMGRLQRDNVAAYFAGDDLPAPVV